MTNIQELIETTNHLCKTLDAVIVNEKKFCQDVSCELEKLNWNNTKISNGLKQVGEYIRK